MNEVIDDLMYESGLTAQGCWDEMDEYNRTAIMKFAELIIKECANVCHVHGWGMLEHNMSGHDVADGCGTMIKEHFGVEE